MFIYCRHGQSAANVYEGPFEHYPHADPDLTKLGEKQAVEGGKAFKEWAEENDVTVTRVACSPLRRAIRTAVLYMQAAGYENGSYTLVIDPNLSERVDGTPSVTGTPKSELLDFLENEPAYKGMSFDAGAITKENWWFESADPEDPFEPADDFIDRLLAVYASHIKPADENGEVILAFSHGGVGLTLTQFETMENCQTVHIPAFGEPRTLFIPKTSEPPPPPQMPPRNKFEP